MSEHLKSNVKFSAIRAKSELLVLHDFFTLCFQYRCGFLNNKAAFFIAVTCTVSSYQQRILSVHVSTLNILLFKRLEMNAEWMNAYKICKCSSFQFSQY